MIKEKAKLCVTCGLPLKDDDAYGGSKTHKGACRETRRKKTGSDARRRWRSEHPNRDAKPLVRTANCVICGEPIVGRSIRAITCSNECGETHRRNINKVTRKAERAAANRCKPRLPRVPGAPLEPRKTRMDKSAVKNTWDNLYSVNFFVRPEAITVIKTNRPGIVAELLECPEGINPHRITLHCCGESGCWQIRIGGKRITDEQRNRWAYSGQTFSYRIRQLEMETS